MHDPKVAIVQLLIWLFGAYFSMELGNAEMLLRAGLGWARLRIGAENPLDQLRRAVGSAERLRRGARVGGEHQADQRRKRVRAGLLHGGSAMVLDRAPADAEVDGNVLAGIAGESSSIIWRRRAVRPANRLGRKLGIRAVAEPLPLSSAGIGMSSFRA